MKKLLLFLFLSIPTILYSQIGWDITSIKKLPAEKFSRFEKKIAINPQDTMLWGTWTYVLHPVIDVAAAMKISKEEYGAKIKEDVDTVEFRKNFQFVMHEIFSNTSFTFFDYNNLVIQAYSNPLKDPRHPPKVSIGYWQHISENTYEVVFGKDKVNVFELIDGYLVLLLDTNLVNKTYKKIYKNSVTLINIDHIERYDKK